VTEVLQTRTAGDAGEDGVEAVDERLHDAAAVGEVIGVGPVRPSRRWVISVTALAREMMATRRRRSITPVTTSSLTVGRVERLWLRSTASSLPAMSLPPAESRIAFGSRFWRPSFSRRCASLSSWPVS
jgi:hypothetical protein